MDVVFSRPISYELSRDWHERKKESYERLVRVNNQVSPYGRTYADSPEPRPCESLIEEWHRNSYPTQNVVIELKQSPLWRLMSDLDGAVFELILWEERIARLIDATDNERSACFTDDLEVRHRWTIEFEIDNLESIIRACNRIMTLNFDIRLLRTEINRRQSRRDLRKKRQFRGRVWFDYQGFGRARYHSVRDEISREIEIANHVLEGMSILDPVQSISNVEAVINRFEEFCQIFNMDDLVQKRRIKFILFASILPREDFSRFLNSANVERGSFEELKSFVVKTYTQVCEKLRQPESRAQEESLLKEEVDKILDSRDDKLCKVTEESRILGTELLTLTTERNLADVIQSCDVTTSSSKKSLPRKINSNDQNLAASAAEYKHVDVIPNCDVTTSSGRKQSTSESFANEVASEQNCYKFKLDEEKSSSELRDISRVELRSSMYCKPVEPKSARNERVSCEAEP